MALLYLNVITPIATLLLLAKSLDHAPIAIAIFRALKRQTRSPTVSRATPYATRIPIHLRNTDARVKLHTTM